MMISRTIQSGLVGAIASVALAGATPASANALFGFGGTFQAYGTNAPNNFNENDSFALGTQTIAGGTLSLTISTSPGPGGSEWLVFDFQTMAPPTGGPAPAIAGDPTQDWQMGVGNVPFLQNLALEHYFLDWGSNGALIDPTNAVGANTPLELNPITGSGTVFGQDVSPALVEGLGGLEGDLLPFGDTLDGWGFDSSNVNEFQIGGLYKPAPAPEPATIALLGAGLVGAAAARRRRKRR